MNGFDEWDRNSVIIWIYGYIAYKDFMNTYWRFKFCLSGTIDDSNVVSCRISYDYKDYQGCDAYDPTEPNPYRDETILNLMIP
jgi:hypothetical protein